MYGLLTMSSILSPFNPGPLTLFLTAFDIITLPSDVKDPVQLLRVIYDLNMLKNNEGFVGFMSYI
jgi:hypothetical protein